MINPVGPAFGMISSIFISMGAISKLGVGSLAIHDTISKDQTLDFEGVCLLASGERTIRHLLKTIDQK